VHPSLQRVHLIRLADDPLPRYRPVDRLQLLVARRLPGGGLARDLGVDVFGIDVVREADGTIGQIRHGISQMSHGSRRDLRSLPARPRPGKPRQAVGGSRGVAQGRGASRQRHFPPSNPSVDRRFSPGTLPRPRGNVLVKPRRSRSVQDLRQGRRPREIRAA